MAIQQHQWQQAIQRIRQPVCTTMSVILVAGVAIACQPQPPSTTPPSTPPIDTSASPTPVRPDATIYRNDAFNFQFSYPMNYTLDDTFEGDTSDERRIASIELWSASDYQRIQNDAFQGSEYPPNVNISVYTNPDQLPLEEWIRTGDRFVGIPIVVYKQVAGQNAVTFQSTGLYENDNTVVATPDGQHVIVINLSKINPTEPSDYDAIYQEVVNTLQFTAD